MSHAARIRIVNEILERMEKKYSLEEIANHLMYLLADAYPLLSASVIALDRERGEASIVAHRGLSLSFMKALYGRPPIPLLRDAADRVVAIVPGDPRAGEAGYRLEHEYASLIAVPCRVQGETIGVLVADSRDPELLAPEIRDAFLAYARLAAVFLLVRHLRAKIPVVPEVDTVTGLYSFRFFHEILDREIKRAAKLGHPVNLLFVKVRFLRDLNNVYGHVAGDSALRQVAEIVRKQMREIDYAARAGGSIYVVMPQEEKEEAVRAARRIVEEIGARPIGKGDLQIRLAVGVATYPADGATERILIPHTEAMVHESIRKGGNAVTVFGE